MKNMYCKKIKKLKIKKKSDKMTKSKKLEVNYTYRSQLRFIQIIKSCAARYVKYFEIRRSELYAISVKIKSDFDTNNHV